MAWSVQNVSESSSIDNPCRFYYHFDDALKVKQDQQYVSPTKLAVGLPRSSYTKSSAELPEFAGQLSRSTPEEPKSSALHSMEIKRAQLLQLHAADGSTKSNASPGPAQLTTFPSKGSQRKSSIGELHK